MGKNEKVYLSEVNFVSRFSLLLFGGDLEVKNNALIVDGWLKFKVGDKGKSNAVLIQELRNELDRVMLKHVVYRDFESEMDKYSQQVLDIIRQLLAEK